MHEKINYFFISKETGEFHLHYDNKNILYERHYNKKGYWSEYKIITKQASVSQAVTIDSENNIWAVYQQLSGNIALQNILKPESTATVLLNAKNSDLYDKFFELCEANGDITLFFSLKNSGQRLLSYIGNICKGPGSPAAIDRLPLLYPGFSVINHEKNNIYIFYIKNTETDIVPGYRVLDTESFSHGEFIPIKGFEQVKSNLYKWPVCASDSNGILYLFMFIKKNEKTEIYFSKKIPGKNDFQPFQKAPDISLIPSDIYVCGDKNALYVLWVQNDELFYIMKLNESLNFTTPKSFIPPKGFLPSLYKYRSKNNDKIFCQDYIPGFLTPSFKFAFDNDKILEKARDEELKITINSSVETLKSELVKYTENEKIINDRIDNLELKISYLEKELSKFSTAKRQVK